MKGPSGEIKMRSGANPGKDKNRPPRTIIAYATEEDKTAQGLDDPNKNNTYTVQLLEYLSIPGLPIQEVFQRASTAVIEKTEEKQRPYFGFGEISSEELDFVFKKGAVQIMPSPP